MEQQGDLLKKGEFSFYDKKLSQDAKPQSLDKD